MALLDKLKNWLKPVTPAPTPEPAPTPNTPGLTDYVRAWRLLRDIPFRKIWPGLVSIPMIVFFAVSGIVAWLFFVLGFIVRLFQFGAGN